MTLDLCFIYADGETPAMSLYAGYRYTLRSGYAYLSRYFNPSLGSPFYVANPADFLSYSGSFTVRKAGVYLVSASVYVSSVSTCLQHIRGLPLHTDGFTVNFCLKSITLLQ